MDTYRFTHFRGSLKCAKRHTMILSRENNTLDGDVSFRAFQGVPEMRETIHKDV